MSDYNWIPGTIIDHERYGEGVISRNKMTSVEVFFARGGKMEFSKNSFQARVVESSDRDVHLYQTTPQPLLENYSLRTPSSLLWQRRPQRSSFYFLK